MRCRASDRRSFETVGWIMMFRTPYVAKRLSTFRRLVAKGRRWWAIGADAEYGVVLLGDAKEFPIVNTWLAESAWRLHDFSGFVPARDRETALVIGDALSLACAVLASLETEHEEASERSVSR